MNIHKLELEGVKLKKMNKQQLEHVVQLVDIELDNYSKASKDYDEEKYQRFSVPYIAGWTELKDRVINEMDKLK